MLCFTWILYIWNIFQYIPNIPIIKARVGYLEKPTSLILRVSNQKHRRPPSRPGSKASPWKHSGIAGWLQQYLHPAWRKTLVTCLEEDSGHMQWEGHSVHREPGGQVRGSQSFNSGQKKWLVVLITGLPQPERVDFVLFLYYLIDWFLSGCQENVNNDVKRKISKNLRAWIPHSTLKSEYSLPTVTNVPVK